MKNASKPPESSDSVPSAVARLRVISETPPPEYPADLEAKRREICGGVDPEKLMETDPKRFVEISGELGRVESEDRARRDAVMRVREKFNDQARSVIVAVDELIGGIQAEIGRLHQANADAVRAHCERALRATGFFLDADVPHLSGRMALMREETGFQARWPSGVGTTDRTFEGGVAVISPDVPPRVVLGCWEAAMATLQAVRAHSEELRKAKILR